MRDLVARGLGSPDDDPLYVVAIGAITNVASALLTEPALAGKIVVVWLGGHALTWPGRLGRAGMTGRRTLGFVIMTWSPRVRGRRCPG